jgi:hypothetical protein
VAGGAISTGHASLQILTGEEEQVLVAAVVASHPRVDTVVVRPRVGGGAILLGQAVPHLPPIQAHLPPTPGVGPLHRRGTRRVRSGTCIRLGLRVQHPNPKP